MQKHGGNALRGHVACGFMREIPHEGARAFVVGGVAFVEDFAARRFVPNMPPPGCIPGADRFRAVGYDAGAVTACPCEKACASEVLL